MIVINTESLELGKNFKNIKSESVVFSFLDFQLAK